MPKLESQHLRRSGPRRSARRRWRWAWSLAVGGLTVVAPPTLIAEGTVASWLAEGDSFFARFDNARARQAYQRAVDLDPASFVALDRLARVEHDLALDLIAEDRRGEAEAQLERAVRTAESLAGLHPDRPAAHLVLAASYGSQALFAGGKEKVRLGQAVEEHCRRALDLDPGYALPYAVLGVYYREVAELNWVQRSLARLLYGRLPKASHELAVANLKGAVELDPELSFGHYELALTYRGLDQPELARRHLRRVLEVPPNTSQDVRNRERARELLSAE